MNEKGFFSKLLAGLLQILFILGILRGEFAGYITPLPIMAQETDS